MKKVFFLLAFISLASFSFASVNPVDECALEEMMFFDCNGDLGACVTSVGPVTTPASPVNLIIFQFGVGIVATIAADCDTDNIDLPTGTYAIFAQNTSNNNVTVEYKYGFCNGSIFDTGVVGLGPGGFSGPLGGFFNIP